MAVEKVGTMPKAQSIGLDTSSATGGAAKPSPGVGLRFKRRRRRLLLVFAFLLTATLAWYTLLRGRGSTNPESLSLLLKTKEHGAGNGNSNSNSVDGGSSADENGNIIGALFDIDAVNKYFNRLTEETKKAEEQTEKKESQLLDQVNDAEETLLNDAEELRKLYLSKEHDGMINLGSTGNMADARLNVLKLKNKMSELEDLEVKENLDKAKDGLKLNSANKDRSIPLSDSLIPDEESFSKIKTDDFIKGDITFQNFFSHILELISRNHLSFPLKRRMTLENGKPVIDNVLFYEDTVETLSEQQLYTFFDFPQNFIDDLKMKHENVVNGIPDIVPHFYNGNGYVAVGGGLYSWYALLGIETLRKVGSTLPVEIFLPNESDYDYQYCEKILPQLNAKCIEMHRVFGSEGLKNFQVEGYQYKAFALLASSFENAFLMDSDTYAVSNPDVLFESELYQNYKMITWPDFWRRTTSPVFYEIRGTEVGMVPVRHLNDFFVNPEFLSKPEDDVSTAITFHDRAGTIPDWTTESGEMLINKKEHFKSLILALYYNYDGPYGYYPLLSQGGAGEGDKETFVAAANFYNKKYYQVYKKPERFFGWFNNVQNYEHSTIVQYDPLLDYEMLQQVHTQLRQDMESQGADFVYDYNKYYSDVFTPDVCKPIFYHVHDPKLNPYKIMEEKWTENLEGKKIRNLAEDFPRINFDLERFLWNVMNHYLCELKINIPEFEGKDADKMCNEFMVDELAYLDKSSDKIDAVYSPTNNVEQMHGGRDWN